jgi:hypothetical protein
MAAAAVDGEVQPRLPRVVLAAAAQAELTAQMMLLVLTEPQIRAVVVAAPVVLQT